MQWFYYALFDNFFITRCAAIQNLKLQAVPPLGQDPSTTVEYLEVLHYANSWKMVTIQ